MTFHKKKLSFFNLDAGQCGKIGTCLGVEVLKLRTCPSGDGYVATQRIAKRYLHFKIK